MCVEKERGWWSWVSMGISGQAWTGQVCILVSVSVYGTRPGQTQVRYVKDGKVLKVSNVCLIWGTLKNKRNHADYWIGPWEYGNMIEPERAVLSPIWMFKPCSVCMHEGSSEWVLTTLALHPHSWGMRTGKEELKMNTSEAKLRLFLGNCYSVNQKRKL